MSTTANGQPAAVTYRHGQLFAVAVLTMSTTGSTTGIARIALFGDPGVVARFTGITG